MTVSELIDILRTMPQQAQVAYIWDGHARDRADFVWLSQGGEVMICGEDNVVYGTEERPIGEPSEERDPYWRTPRKIARRVWPNA